MSRSTFEAISTMGTRLNGWIKVLVVVASLVAGWVTLQGDVGHNAEEIAKVETRRKEDRAEMLEQFREVNQKLQRIQELMIEDRRSR